MRQVLSLTVLLCAVAPLAAAGDELAGARAAFFGLTFLDTSTEGAINGVREDETARLERTEAYVAERLREHGIALVALDPVAEELERTLNPADCNDCDLRMAQRLGARYAIVGEVQKVSNLILAMNLYIRDAETGAFLRGQAVDIRGNTDDAWMRGMRYILDRNVFAEPG